MNTKKIGLGLSLLISLLGLSACNSADKILDDVHDNIDKDRESFISFINTRDEMADFYVYPNIMLRKIFQSEYKALGVLAGEVSYPYRYDFYRKYVDSQVGVRNSNAHDHEATFDFDIKENAKYWAVPWIDNSNDKIAFFEKSTRQKENVYTVRVFTNSSVELYINGQVEPVSKTVKGVVSASYEISNCATGIAVGATAIDFCQQAEFGKGYLIVSKEQGGFIVAPEQQ